MICYYFDGDITKGCNCHVGTCDEKVCLIVCSVMGDIRTGYNKERYFMCPSEVDNVMNKFLCSKGMEL